MGSPAELVNGWPGMETPVFCFKCTYAESQDESVSQAGPQAVTDI